MIYMIYITVGKTTPRTSSSCAAHGAFTEVKAARSLPLPRIPSLIVAAACRKKQLWAVWLSPALHWW